MTPDDVIAADRTAWAALSPLYPPALETEETEAVLARRRRRISHLLETDPGGAWVAEVNGEVAGVALALIREDVWGLSLLAVRPDLHGQGIGGRVLAPALDYGQGTRGGIILSSIDPRAMRRYVRAGFRTKPCVAAAGAVNRARMRGGLHARPGDPVADRATIDAASRHVRGAAHAADLPTLIQGRDLFVLEDRGFAVATEGAPAIVAALDDEAARDLLWSCLASAPAGATVHVDFITEGNDWAIEVALDAGLALSPEGPVFVRGETGPFAPYLPSSAYL